MCFLLPPRASVGGRGRPPWELPTRGDRWGKGFSDPIDRSVTRGGCIIIRWQINGLPRGWEDGSREGGRERDAMGALMWQGTLLPMKINTEEGCLLLLRRGHCLLS